MAACTALDAALSLAPLPSPRLNQQRQRLFWRGDGVSPGVRGVRAGVFSGTGGDEPRSPKETAKEKPMSALLQDYLPLVTYRQPDPEKLSAYECGFNAFDDARMKFDVRFYLVAILFIIFDLEVSF